MQNVNIKAPGSSGSQSGSGWYTLKLVAQRRQAHRRHASAATTRRTRRQAAIYDLQFALDIAGPPDLGAALPADGGEPGKAYRAYLAALKKGDIDALAKTMTHERSAEILAHRNDPDFKMMFALHPAERDTDPKIIKGNSKGDAATLELTGKDGDGNAATSRRDDAEGRWQPGGSPRNR